MQFILSFIVGSVIFYTGYMIGYSKVIDYVNKTLEEKMNT